MTDGMARPSTLPEPWLALASAHGGVVKLAALLGVEYTTVERWAARRFQPGKAMRARVDALASRKGLPSPWEAPPPNLQPLERVIPEE